MILAGARDGLEVCFTFLCISIIRYQPEKRIDHRRVSCLTPSTGPPCCVESFLVEGDSWQGVKWCQTENWWMGREHTMQFYPSRQHWHGCNLNLTLNLELHCEEVPGRELKNGDEEPHAVIFQNSCIKMETVSVTIWDSVKSRISSCIRWGQKS